MNLAVQGYRELVLELMGLINRVCFPLMKPRYRQEVEMQLSGIMLKFTTINEIVRVPSARPQSKLTIDSSHSIKSHQTSPFHKP